MSFNAQNSSLVFILSLAEKGCNSRLQNALISSLVSLGSLYTKIVSIQKYLAEEPRIKPFVGLYLRFDEYIGALIALLWRNLNAIQTKGGLLNLFGAEDIAFSRII